MLSLESPESKPPSPLKFNPAWLLEEDYKALVIYSWTHLVPSQSLSFMQMWADNISKVKRVTKSWEGAFHAKQQALLKSTEAGISEIFKQNTSGILTESELEYLNTLELKHHALLKKEE